MDIGSNIEHNNKIQFIYSP